MKMMVKEIFIFILQFVILVKGSHLTPGDGTLRLLGSSSNDGILEIYHSGRWGAVCDSGWNSVASLVACRQLGFPNYLRYTLGNRITNRFWLDNVRCNGYESVLVNCANSRWGGGSCGSTEGIYLQCLIDSTLRLFGSGSNDGIIEIYHSGRWGAVCDNGWNSEASHVACRQLGFPNYLRYTLNNRITNGFWLDDVRCNGDESVLVDCPNNGWGIENCALTDGIYLQCLNDGDIRLLGSGSNDGILEIYHNGRWGAVCDNSWSSGASLVACRQLGFTNYVRYTFRNRITNDYWLHYVSCSRDTQALVDCYKSGWGSGNCGPTQGIYLQCTVAFGMMIGSSVQTLNDLQTLQQGTTLYCSTDSSSSPTRISWTFRPQDQEMEENVTNSAQWDSSGFSKLPISISKLGYYSCLTKQGGIIKRYTVKLTQPALQYGCNGGYCFGVFTPDRTINWATAQSNCKSWGGDLASIRSMGEEKFILSLGESRYGSCWIGHHDRYNEAGTNATLFVSVGGSLSLYRNFYGNEPNQQGNEDCVMLRDWNGGGWNDTSCYTTLSCYVCGKPNCIDGSCFEVLTNNTGINWDLAQSQCELRGGSLASIRSESEEKFLLTLMMDTNSSCLIGLNDRIREAGTNPNRYVWEDNSMSVYRHFRNEEILQSNKDCVVFSSETKAWINSDCADLYNCILCRGTGNCSPGYAFNAAAYDCLDVNECYIANDCDHICTNTVGSYVCSCREEYYLYDAFSCDLIYLSIALKATTSSSSIIQLVWEATSRPVNRLTEIAYSIWIRDVTFETNEQFVLKNSTNNLDLNIDGLFPHRKYEIYVQGRDNETSNSSNVITVRTLTDRPSSVPTDLTAYVINPTTVRLNWIPPRIETHNGVLTQYSILYSRTDRDTEQEVLVNASFQSYNVTDLAEYTNYTFRVAAVNSAGRGVYSGYASARTMESIPSSSPVIVLLAKSSTSISLLLRPQNNLDDINGVITFYEVTYHGKGVDTELRSLEYRPDSVEYLSPVNANLTGLEEGVGYNITARIHTSMGGGPFSSIVVVSTIETAPIGPPLQINILILLSTSITLSWSPPELNLQNGVIIGYVVNYHGLLVDIEERNFTTIYSLTSLTRLEEGVFYEITICAFTKGGVGPCMEIVNRTREIPPGQAPQNVEVEVSGSTSLLITWDPPSKTEENGVILRYNISVVGLGPDTTLFELNTNSTATYLTVENLDEANEYSVTVSAVNSAGTGPYSTSILAVTSQEAPSAAPQGVFGIGTEELILLSWNPPNVSDRNGEITHYKVRYFGAKIDKSKHLLKTVETRSIITGLNAGETYRFKVRAYTSGGPGPFSKIVSVKTDEIPPSAPPTNLTLFIVSYSQIRLIWQEPPLAERNGVISGYDLLIIRVGDLNQGEFSQVAGFERSHTFRNLESNTTYSARVRARTSPGPGPYSLLINATTPEKSILG